MIELGARLGQTLSSRATALEGVPRESRAGEEKGRQDPRKSNRSHVIELFGDVGAGKTTFVRGLAEGLGVKEPITSPSFTISKSYAIPGGGTLVHYDFYRLGDPGLMAEDLAENLDTPDSIVVVEWADSVSDLLPGDHQKIEIKYRDDGTREVTM